MDDKIKVINAHLEFIGSAFRVQDDGKTLSCRVNGVWLVRGFRSTNDLVKFVLNLNRG